MKTLCISLVALLLPYAVLRAGETGGRMMTVTNEKGVVQITAPTFANVAYGTHPKQVIHMRTNCVFPISVLLLGASATLSLADATCEWPARTLRGYGEVSAVTITGEAFSRLEIRCESAEKAGIVHAKFVSDFHALGGVRDETQAVGGISVPVIVAPEQGLVSAFRKDRVVYVVSGATQAGWREGVSALQRKLAGAELTPQAQVPMYLNAWDQHGFRFYYRPWETPGKDVKWKEYPVLGEFDFAKRESSRGFVFWAETANVDNAVGLDNDLWWDWAARAAARRGLPVVVNTMNVEPTWALNGRRGEGMGLMPQFCGSYHSVANSGSAGMRSVSWCAGEAKDAQLEPIRRIVERYAARPNTLEYLEPHGELRHGDYDIFLEYGPVADASFRTFLKEKYGRVSRVAQRWQEGKSLRSWNDVRVPDLATFLGYDGAALDLTGDWRLGYEPVAGTAAEWSGTAFDDTAWPVIHAPGNDVMMFLDKKPAVFRRSFEVPAAWLREGGKAWLYVWDLNEGAHLKEHIVASLNGAVIGDDLTRHATSHWAAFETGGALHAGTNTVAIRVPQGFLGYHVYLSRHEPKQYPELPDGEKARWVDFSDWRQATRISAAQRGLEAIRSADPDRSIICMAPDSSIAGVKKLCERYGAHFHNTGHMGAFWNEFLPMLMRGADLPFSLEPGGPADTLAGFKRMMGYYFTEGVQAIHYFIHVGNILWPEDIRRHFEKIRPLVDTVGKVHPPKAEIAMLFSDRIDNLTGFPWGQNPDVNLPSGYFSWPLNAQFTGEYDFDGLTDLDFADGRADPYRMIIGANTSVMDDKLVNAIEAWVRKGGIFVAFVQTGRHTPEKKDAWPISRLSGYAVADVARAKFTPTEPYEVADWWRFSFVPGQPMFKSDEWDLKSVTANGLKLKALAPDCQDLVRWEDGSTAVGLRPLGKGYVVHMGLKFCRTPLWHGWPDRTQKLFRQLFVWAGLHRVPAIAEGVKFRHYVSNNGLFDMWTLWNERPDQSAETSLVFRDGLKPAFCREVGSEGVAALSTGADGLPAVRGIRLEPLETKIFVTPKGLIADAPAQWFALQRNWWRGAEPVKHEAAPVTVGQPATAESGEQAAVDLTDGWCYTVLDEAATNDPSPLAAVGLDTAAWPVRRLDCWAVPEELASRHILFRKAFRVPKAWRSGDVELWLKAWFSWTVSGKARYWLDGHEVTSGDGRDGLIVASGLEAGSEHTLAVEVRGEGQVCGVRGNTWLAYTHRPGRVLDLAGAWVTSKDYLAVGQVAKLPGVFNAKLLSRSVDLPVDCGERQVYLRMKASHGITGCLVNGRYVRRHHHALGDTTFLNITPWLTPGASNRIEILAGGAGEIRDVALWVY